MAGPTIARAEIQVDLDGKRIPEEASRLARLAGAIAGDGYKEEWEKRVNAGVDQSMRKIAANLKKRARDDARAAGQLYGQRFRAAIESNLSKVGQSFDQAFKSVGSSVRRGLTSVAGASAGLANTVRGDLNGVQTAARALDTVLNGPLAHSMRELPLTFTSGLRAVDGEFHALNRGASSFTKSINAGTSGALPALTTLSRAIDLPSKALQVFRGESSRALVPLSRLGAEARTTNGRFAALSGAFSKFATAFRTGLSHLTAPISSITREFADQMKLGLAGVAEDFVRFGRRASVAVKNVGTDLGLLKQIATLTGQSFGEVLATRALAEVNALGFRLNRAFRGAPFNLLGSTLGLQITSGLKLAAQRIAPVLSGIASGFSGFGRRVAPVVSGIGSAFSTLERQITGRLSLAFGFLATDAAHAAESVGRAFSRVPGLASSAFSSLRSTAQRAFTGMATGAANLGRSIGTGFRNAGTLVSEFAKGVSLSTQAVVQGFGRARLAGESFRRGITTAFRGLNDGIVSGLRDADVLLTGWTTKLLGEFGRIRRVLSTGGKDIGNFGKEVGGLGSTFGKLAGSMRGFDPFDNFGAAVVTIIALLQPLAGLLAAAAGGITVLGAAAGAALVGVGAFYAILKGIGKIDAGGLAKMSKQARDTTTAFQDLFGTVNKSGKLKIGRIFTDLQDGLVKSFLSTKNLDSTLRTLSNTTLPSMANLLKPLGATIGAVFKSFADDLGATSTMTALHTIIGSISTQLPQLQKIASTAFGIIGQLFIDASPFALQFEKDLGRTLATFLKFLKSPEGHKEVQGWLTDAMSTLGKVGGVIDTVWKAFQKLVTPTGIKNLADILSNLGKSAPGLADLGNALAPVGVAIGSLVKAVGDVATSMTPLNNFIGALDRLAKITFHGTNVGVSKSDLSEWQTLADAINGVSDASIVIQARFDGFFFNLATKLDQGSQQWQNFFAGIGRAGAAFGTLMDDIFNRRFDKVSGDMSRLTGAIGSAFGSLGKETQASAGFMKDLTNKIDEQVGKYANVKGASDAYLVALQGVPPTVKTQVLLDQIAAGRNLSDFKTTLASLPAKQQVQLLTNAAQAHQDLSAFKGVIATLPAKQQFTILDNVAQAGGKLGAFKGIVAALPTKQQFTILDNAAKAGGDVSAFKRIIGSLPKSQQVKFLEDALAHGAKVSTYHGIISALPKSSQLKLLEDATLHGAHVKGYTGLIKALPKSWQTKFAEDAAAHGVRVKGYTGVIKAVPKTGTTTFSDNANTVRGHVSNLHGAISAVPRSVTISVGLSGAQAALDKVNSLRRLAGAVAVAANGGILDGGRLKQFAGGGINGRDGMIAPGGANILWAEPQTGWEAYISGKAGKSTANINTWMEAGRRLGVLDGAGSKTVNAPVTIYTTNADPRQVAAAAIDRLVPQL